MSHGSSSLGQNPRLGYSVSDEWDKEGVLTLRPRSSLGVIVPGFRDIRGYRAMYADFAASIRAGRQPEMSLERALEDQRLMDQVYATI